jgi:hypothetical protein
MIGSATAVQLTLLGLNDGRISGRPGRAGTKWAEGVEGLTRAARRD